MAGSCSRATLGQIEAMRAERPNLALDPDRLAAGEDVVAEALQWAIPQLGQGPLLIYSSMPPDELARVQAALGREQAGEIGIKTPTANAAMRGTQLFVQVDDHRSFFQVIEGAIELSNPRGRLVLRPGEAGEARPGRAPQRTATFARGSITFLESSCPTRDCAQPGKVFAADTEKGCYFFS